MVNLSKRRFSDAGDLIQGPGNATQVFLLFQERTSYNSSELMFRDLPAPFELEAGFRPRSYRLRFDSRVAGVSLPPLPTPLAIRDYGSDRTSLRALCTNSGKNIGEHEATTLEDAQVGGKQTDPLFAYAPS